MIVVTNLQLLPAHYQRCYSACVKSMCLSMHGPLSWGEALWITWEERGLPDIVQAQKQHAHTFQPCMWKGRGGRKY